MFSLCLNALAIYGRLIVIGMISQVSFLEVSYVALYLNAFVTGTFQLLQYYISFL